MTLSPGTRLGAYEILSLRGSGGMGEVYKARDRRTGRDVAIKVLNERSLNALDLDVLTSEGRVLGALNHPNIATLFELSDSNGSPFLVMELVERGTLEERLV